MWKKVALKRAFAVDPRRRTRVVLPDAFPHCAQLIEVGVGVEWNQRRPLEALSGNAVKFDEADAAWCGAVERMCVKGEAPDGGIERDGSEGPRDCDRRQEAQSEAEEEA